MFYKITQSKCWITTSKSLFIILGFTIFLSSFFQLHGRMFYFKIRDYRPFSCSSFSCSSFSCTALLVAALLVAALLVAALLVAALLVAALLVAALLVAALLVELCLTKCQIACDSQVTVKLQSNLWDYPL